MRELLAQAGGLALETSEPALAGSGCYAMCERVGGDAGEHATWDEAAPERALVEGLGVTVAGAAPAESLVWWCVRLVPRRSGRATRGRAPAHDGVRAVPDDCGSCGVHVGRCPRAAASGVVAALPS